MSGFKLLAIRPLKGCSKDYSKILKLGQIYSFYQEYTFHLEAENDPHSHVSRISFERSVPENLYSEDPLAINISAVVGKNGSGKSSLIEFLYYAVYILGNFVTLSGLETNEPILKSYPQMLKSDIKWKLKLMRSSKGIVKRVREINSLIALLPLEETKHDRLLEEFRGSFFYAINDNYYELRIGADVQVDTLIIKSDAVNTVARDIKLINVLQNTSKISHEILAHFFYTISINYSHYALNSNFVGKWINTLFHKNDGYQTPAVINPMRTAGNFDINKEIVFAKYRLLSNVLIERLATKTDKIYVTERQFVDKIQFKYNGNKVRESSITDTGNELRGKTIDNNREVFLLNDLYSHFLPGNLRILLMQQDMPFRNEIGNYIIQKVDQIIETYDLFEEGYSYDMTYDNLSDRTQFVEKLLSNSSHIVFKLKQALNYFLQNLIHPTPLELPWYKSLDDSSEQIFEFSIPELLNWMGVEKVSEVFEHLPPAIFDIDFVLSNNAGDSSMFSQLSSGEQQLIHSTQSAIYHINNLESIHTSEIHPIRYEHINIIYDEIELYFHPEYQREFISRFRNGLMKLGLGREKGIKSINILFSTHSPFILSDIPSSNILRLTIDDEGKSKPSHPRRQTFAANIYDLLNDDFFLERGVIGDFARQRIEGINRKNVISEDDLKEIELIGDPLLRGVLYERAMKKISNFDLIKRQIAFLEEQLKNNDAADTQI